MLAGTGLVICSGCGKVVPAAAGLCQICGEQFSALIIEAMVVEAELEVLEAA